MNILDIAIVLTLFATSTLGAIQGLSQRKWTVFSLTFGFLIALTWRSMVGDWFSSWIDVDWQRQILGFAIIWLAVWLVATFARNSLSRLIEASELKILDRFLGGLFSFLKTLLVMALLFELLRFVGLDSLPWWRDSWVLNATQSAQEMVRDFVISGQLQDWLDHALQRWQDIFARFAEILEESGTQMIEMEAMESS